MDPKIGHEIAKSGPTNYQFFGICLSDCWCLFWIHFWSNFGVKEAMMRQDGPKKALKRHLKSLKTRKIRVRKLTFFVFDKCWRRFGIHNGPQNLQKINWKSERTWDCEKTCKLRCKNETWRGWALVWSLNRCAQIKGRDSFVCSVLASYGRMRLCSYDAIAISTWQQDLVAV